MLARPIQARATNARQTPVAGAIVRFRVTRGASTGTTLFDSVAVSGPDGVARTYLRLGSAIDTSVVEATLADTPTAIARFRAVATTPPRLDGVAPATFAAGDTVRLRGKGFVAAADSNAVILGSTRVRVLRVDGDTSLTVVVPPCLAAGALSVSAIIGTVLSASVTGTFTSPASPISLKPLDGITVSGADLTSCIQLVAGGATYLIVPHSATSGSSRQIDFTVSTTASTLGTELPGTQTSPAPIVAVATPSIVQRFDEALREREAQLVDEARRAGVLRPAPDMIAGRAAAAAAPTVGSSRNFQVLSDFAGNAFKRVSAKLRYAGDNILLYVDVDQPQGSFTDAELRTFGQLFDQTLYDVNVRAFGAESDIDANGRVIVVLTPVVNALTKSADCTASGFITGFQYGLDLLPTQANSNRGEIFYAFVPDVAGTRSCVHTKADVERLVPATFVHEFQHMISFGQHVVARGGNSEVLWLNEGLSHIAEELAGKTFEAKFPPPAGRADPSQLFPDSAQGFLTPNMRNAQGFLATPGTVSATAISGSGTLAERGGAWMFLRWLGDQKGESIYGRLVQTSRTGIANVEEQSGETFPSLFGDFTTAIYTDSLPGIPRNQIPTRLRFTSRNLRQIFKRFADLDQTDRTPQFPLNPVLFSVGESVTGSLTPGSMVYYRLRGAEGNVAIRFARPDQSVFLPGDQVQLGIFRLP
jgi:hypothetical protein